MENIRNHFCEGEIEAFKICNDIGHRNYRNSQRFKKEGESFESIYTQNLPMIGLTKFYH